MKKKLFPLISILVLVILFGIAATCNMCGLNLSTETTASITGDTETIETSVEATEAEETATEATEEDTVKETTKEETTETSKSGSTDTTKSSSTDTQAVAPTIKLQIYEGPTYSQADDVCYYRIEAIVTGSPTPSATFSKDDSSGALGSKKVQVNLTKSSPNYILTAKAKNSAGEATATLNLTWGCGPSNNPPKIDTISLISTGDIVTNTLYEVTAYAKDPDGDSLTYEWFTNGGALKNVESNPVKWGTPGTPGTYNIGVKVSDGKGGEDAKSMNIEVKQQTSTNLNLNHVAEEEGYVSTWPSSSTGNIAAGDHTENASHRGFMSFDITNLAGATIQDAKLTLNYASIFGDLSNFGELWIEAVDHGADPLVFQDYYLTGTPIQSFPASGIGNITCTSPNLKTQLQNAINAGKLRFQLRIRFSVPTDGDKVMDWLGYQAQNITLNVTFLK